MAFRQEDFFPVIASGGMDRDDKDFARKIRRSAGGPDVFRPGGMEGQGRGRAVRAQLFPVPVPGAAERGGRRQFDAADRAFRREILETQAEIGGHMAEMQGHLIRQGLVAARFGGEDLGRLVRRALQRGLDRRDDDAPGFPAGRKGHRSRCGRQGTEHIRSAPRSVHFQGKACRDTVLGGCHRHLHGFRKALGHADTRIVRGPEGRITFAVSLSEDRLGGQGAETELYRLCPLGKILFPGDAARRHGGKQEYEDNFSHY